MALRPRCCIQNFCLKGIEENFRLGRPGEQFTCPECHRVYQLMVRERGQLLWTEITRPSITCPRCAAVSYNPNDIREQYCGACHRFHDETRP